MLGSSIVVINNILGCNGDRMKGSNMTQAKQGDTVSVHYMGMLENGTIFDSSSGREPLQFVIGEGMLIPNFEQAAIGMTPGESKTIKIPSDEAYGSYHDELVMAVERKEFPPDFEADVGERLRIRQADGEEFIATVTQISETSVTLDANHPLAGECLVFDIQLVEIV